MTPEGWDGVAPIYERVVAPNTARLAQELLDALAVRRGERLLDVAAGTGSASVLAAKRGAHVVATDFSPAMIAKLRSHASREGVAVDARVMDGQRLELPDGSFDVATSVLGLIFFSDRVQGLREMRRALRPGGRVGIVAWGPPEKVDFATIFGGAMRAAMPNMPPPPGPPPFHSMADPKLIEKEMMQAGFGDIHVRTTTTRWPLASAEAIWTDYAPAGPGAEGMLAHMDEATRDRFHKELVRLVGERAKDGRIEIVSEVNIATATR
jgi:SAM-dependent methyltransferase